MNATNILNGKVALATGASRGIGFAIAERLCELGAVVAICARNEKELGEAAGRLRGTGAKIAAIAADVTQPGSIAGLVRKCVTELGPIDILVNNAGIGRFGEFHKLSERDFDDVMDTNLKGVFLLSREVAPSMIERGTGHIINIASLAGKNAFPGGGIYCASKWGLLGLTYCMAEELRVHGIRVAAICPGTVATEFSPHAGKDPAKMLQAADVAHAVESLVTQAPQSFISEILLRPAQKP